MRIAGTSVPVPNGERIAAISIAAENVRLSLDGAARENWALPGTVVDVFYLGFSALLHVQINGGPSIPVRLRARDLPNGISAGTKVWVDWDVSEARGHAD